MAIDDRDTVTGSLIFLDTGAPDTGVDPTEVSKQANDVGTRIIRPNLTALEAYLYKRKGLAGLDESTMLPYVHDGSSWKPDRAFAETAGRSYVNATGGVTVTFPAGKFTFRPALVVTPYNATSVLVPHVTSLTKDSFHVRVYTLDGVATTANVSWTAVQRRTDGLNE